MKMLNQQLKNIHGGNASLIQSWLINTLTTTAMIYGYDYYNNIYRGSSISSVVSNEIDAIQHTLNTELDELNQQLEITENHLETLASSSLDLLHNAFTR
ncbi:hypothetical protein EBR43_08095 [bacterium]|jgi:hypothetical protein|nr:hypothetical protein [bacterium]NBX72167.1 hypothetical protein [bacterium]